MYQSQNNETEIVLKYFNGHVGNVLDIGANDGITLSNSYDLIKMGWSATLVEPCKKAFESIINLHGSNPKVNALNFCVGAYTGECDFYESGNHLPEGVDFSLVSTICEDQTKRWDKVEFNRVAAPIKTFADSGISGVFDYITIDCEGMDFSILAQMNLDDLACQCICLEHNGDTQVLEHMKRYCSMFGLTKQLLINAENIILAK